MHKLVILIGPLDDNQTFEHDWPDFLHQAEMMPGLQREATSQIEHFLYGSGHYLMMHELYFDTFKDLQLAMESTPGKAAGTLLQRITGGNLSLFIADHKEDSIENIRKFQSRDNETNEA